MPVQIVRTYNVTTANQPRKAVVKMVPLNQPSSSGFTSNTSAPPPVQTANTSAPPPYCETNAPPPYCESKMSEV